MDFPVNLCANRKTLKPRISLIKKFSKVGWSSGGFRINKNLALFFLTGIWGYPPTFMVYAKSEDTVSAYPRLLPTGRSLSAKAGGAVRLGEFENTSADWALLGVRGYSSKRAVSNNAGVLNLTTYFNNF